MSRTIDPALQPEHEHESDSELVADLWGEDPHAPQAHTLLDDIVYGEGPRFRVATGELYFTDMHDKKVIKYCLATGERTLVYDDPQDMLSGLGWLPDGRMLISSMNKRQVLIHSEETHSTEIYADVKDVTQVRANDMVVSTSGRAYLGSFGFHHADLMSISSSVIVSIGTDGSVRVEATGVVFPNGMVTTPDGKTLIVGETFEGRLTAYDIGEDGKLSVGRLWADVGALVDGICLDAEGCVWASIVQPGMYQTGGGLVRVKEGGEIADMLGFGTNGIKNSVYACQLGTDAEGKHHLFFLEAATSYDDEIWRHGPEAARKNGQLRAIEVPRRLSVTSRKGSRDTAAAAAAARGVMKTAATPPAPSNAGSTPPPTQNSAAAAPKTQAPAAQDTPLDATQPPTEEYCAQGMTTLWPDSRRYLRNLVLGRECRNVFNLEPNTIFLNHNAYGVAPKPVMQAQAHFVNKMEMNPDRFMRREAPAMLRQAAKHLARFVHADADDMVFVTNATTGMNAVLQSLDLQNDDEVLCLNLTCEFSSLCCCMQDQDLTFVELKVVDVVLPIESYDALVQQVVDAITPNTRLAVLDHIASTTGFVLPLEKLIPIFHAKNIPVLVDGASAPGQLPLNLNELGADFYVGTAYKWLFGCKSCSFLHVSKPYQNTVRPVVTSLAYGQGFVEEFAIQGTRDEANFLTLVSALDFYESVGVSRVYAHNKSLIDWAGEYLATTWKTNILLPAWQRAPFVCNVRIPVEWPTTSAGVPMSHDEALPLCDAIMDFLDDQYRIVVRVVPFQSELYVRISAQMYNERRDYEQLGQAMLELTNTPTLGDYLARMRI
ncbi:unnamed protein product [Phytophthora fragariaefolia]|uniref:Unnamed protein product n=1 Tax=Phytophthora fragariaefolia TaxID=1490495 RepID=A0A9W6UEI8_9STRA|nr:unnamed protein product [Phytophthora fragariaefolia]